MDQKGNQFSTFAGVFTPSILTILGAIMFLRAGYVVGEAGILNAILILCAAEVICLLTAVSMSAIATNTPSELKIRLDDMQVTTEFVRLEGTSESFESVYNWQHLLGNALYFSTVDIHDVHREPNGKIIHFVVLASFTLEKST